LGLYRVKGMEKIVKVSQKWLKKFIDKQKKREFVVKTG
jgi:hypothetical protein